MARILFRKMEAESKRKLCVFSHYFEGSFIPYYVLVYIKELKNYFGEILLVTNQRVISNRAEISDPFIKLLLVDNEGYDFGMFYKAFQIVNIQKYEQIACVNDSNIVFGSLDFLFDWGNRQNTDFWGLVDSWQKPKLTEHKEFYHIQSHFLVFNEKAIKILPEFLQQVDFQKLANEPDKKLLRKKVIDIWEIGISQFLLKNNLKCMTYINSKEYSERYYNGEDVNVTMKLYEIMVQQGIPVIKKRVITRKKLFEIVKARKTWEKLILKYADGNFKPEKIIDELQLIRKIA